MSKIYYILTGLAVAFLGFTGTAIAAGEVAPEGGSWVDLAKPVYDAVMHGEYWLAAAFALILVVALLKKVPGKWGERINGTYGKSITVLVASYGGAVVTALLAGGPGTAFTLGVAWTALKVALAAAGGYSMLRKLAVPVLRKLADKVPGTFKPIFTLILFVLDGKTPTETAEAAGDAAVVANPATGATGAAKTDVTEI